MRQIVEEEDEKNNRGEDNDREDGLTVGRYESIFD